MELSKEKEHLVLENRKLVHYLAQKLGVTQTFAEYDDIIQEGTIGLTKAAITFEPSQGNTFATYASMCIRNEIFMYLRKNKKHANNISIDEPIGDDGEGSEITLRDKIESPDGEFAEEIAIREEFANIISNVLNSLEGKARIVMLYRIGKMHQREIAKRLNISQSYVSRLAKKAEKKVRENFNKKPYGKEVFSMTTKGDNYKISFLSKDVGNFKKIFATLLQNIESAETLPDFQITCNKERITLLIYAHPEAFVFIAKIIQEIDDFSMIFVSNKNKISNVVDENVDNETSKKLEQNKSIEKDESTTDVEEVCTDVVKKSEEVVQDKIIDNSVQDFIETDSTSEETADCTEKKNNQVKKVRDYMLTKDSFTVKELKKHFSDLPGGTIGNAVYLAKSKGLISPRGKGEYIVNKD